MTSHARIFFWRFLLVSIRQFAMAIACKNPHCTCISTYGCKKKSNVSFSKKDFILARSFSLKMLCRYQTVCDGYCVQALTQWASIWTFGLRRHIELWVQEKQSNVSFPKTGSRFNDEVLGTSAQLTQHIFTSHAIGVIELRNPDTRCICRAQRGCSCHHRKPKIRFMKPVPRAVAYFFETLLAELIRELGPAHHHSPLITSKQLRSC